MFGVLELFYTRAEIDKDVARRQVESSQNPNSSRRIMCYARYSKTTRSQPLFREDCSRSRELAKTTETFIRIWIRQMPVTDCSHPINSPNPLIPPSSPSARRPTYATPVYTPHPSHSPHNTSTKSPLDNLSYSPQFPSAHPRVHPNGPTCRPCS